MRRSATRSSASRVARALAAALLLAIPAGGLSAGELYRWVTEDGRTEIGPNPPPGASAVPWSPGQERAAEPTPAAPAPAPASAPAPIPAQKARSANREKCARYRENARQTERRVIEAEAAIARLEQKLETLQSTEIAFSRTSCVSQGINGPKSDCVASRFDRDAEIERAEQALEQAQEKLSDLELNARRSAAPEACTPASAD